MFQFYDRFNNELKHKFTEGTGEFRVEEKMLSPTRNLVTYSLSILYLFTPCLEEISNKYNPEA